MLEDTEETDHILSRSEETTDLQTVLWDPAALLEIPNSHDWVQAIEIATSLWDTSTACRQLKILDDAITDATLAGELE